MGGGPLDPRLWVQRVPFRKGENKSLGSLVGHARQQFLFGIFSLQLLETNPKTRSLIPTPNHGTDKVLAGWKDSKGRPTSDHKSGNDSGNEYRESNTKLGNESGSKSGNKPGTADPDDGQHNGHLRSKAADASGDSESAPGKEG
jgi:hypothetical protein